MLLGFHFDPRTGKTIDRDNKEVLVVPEINGEKQNGPWLIGQVEDLTGRIRFSWVSTRTWHSAGYRNSEGSEIKHEIVHFVCWETSPLAKFSSDRYLSRIGEHLTDHKHMYRMGLASSQWQKSPELEKEWRASQE